MDKTTPKILPEPTMAESGALVNAVDCIAQGGPLREELRITLNVDGGMPQERYLLQLEVSSRGTFALEMEDRLHGRKAARRQEISALELADLMAQMGARDLVRTDFASPLIPPCSLVGRLRIALGDAVHEVVFMADSGQAQNVHSMPSVLVVGAVQALYAFAERRTDTPIRP